MLLNLDCTSASFDTKLLAIAKGFLNIFFWVIEAPKCIKVNKLSSFFRELLDSLDLDLDLSNLGVPEDALVIIQQFLENQTLEAVLGFLNNLFNAGDQFGTGYDEDIFMKTSVDKILYAVSFIIIKKIHLFHNAF